MKAALEILRDKSMIIAIEELAELQQAISKGLRGKLNYDNLTEEIADVEICLEWVRDYFDTFEKDIENWKQFKDHRIKERIENNELD
ncbi:MAG: hypothetical protein HUJ88_11435 [Fusobacterium necrophorum]|nr:hypothetical protein [Fusobacterium necrophorum]